MHRREQIELFEKYISRVSYIFATNKEEMTEHFNENRDFNLAEARHMLYLLCSRASMRPSLIQKLMKGIGYDVHHSALISAIRKADKKMEQKPYRDSVFKIERDATRKGV